MAEGGFMKPDNLNLLLKQQIIRQLEEVDEETEYRVREPEPPYEECISINRTTRSILKFFCDDTTQNYDEIKMELANIHVQESSTTEEHKSLCENYDLLESLLEHLLQHVECMTLEIKSSSRLSLLLNTFAVRENHVNGDISNSLKKLCERPDTDVLEDIKTKLFIALNRNDNIKQLRLELERKRNDYHLAMKNFKIILEVMNVNDKSLGKLRRQLDEVLMNYQHCRCILNQEMPYVVSERMKVLMECLNLLGMECDAWIDQRSELSTLLRHLGNNLKGCEYVLVKKEEIMQSGD